MAVSAASFVVSAAPTESATVEPTAVVSAVSAAFESIAVESTASAVLSSSPSSASRSSWSSSSLVAPPLPSSERRQRGGDGPARIRARVGWRGGARVSLARALLHGPQSHGRCRMGAVAWALSHRPLSHGLLSRPPVARYLSRAARRARTHEERGVSAACPAGICALGSGISCGPASIHVYNTPWYTPARCIPEVYTVVYTVSVLYTVLYTCIGCECGVATNGPQHGRRDTLGARARGGAPTAPHRSHAISRSILR